MSKNITIIIKTFERPYCLEKLLDSYVYFAQKHNWNCQILIADDSTQPYKDQILKRYGTFISEYICLPFHSGVSHGRNVLVQKVKTPYFIHLDDDFILTEQSDLLKMMRILTKSDLDLLGGTWYNRPKKTQGESRFQVLRRLLHEKRFGDFVYELMRKGRPFPYYGNFKVKNDELLVLPISYSPPFSPCDLVINFFIAKTASFQAKNIKWDEDMKTHEHEAFFYEAKLQGLKVGVTEEVSLIHQPMSSPHYDQFRFPKGDVYGKLFLRKHGFSKLTDYIGYSSFQL